MIRPNMHYADLKDSYLFFNIAQKTKAYLQDHPDAHLYRMGIGDVSLPLCDAVIKALHKAVDDYKAAFHNMTDEAKKQGKNPESLTFWDECVYLEHVEDRSE